MDTGSSGSPSTISPVFPPDWKVEEALSLVAGHRELYNRILVQFRERYDDSPERLIAFLSQGNLQEAHRLVHTVKSLASSMGAVLLNRAAVELEVSMARGRCRPRQEPLDRFLAELSRTLQILSPLVH